jgi:hypothetical protein
LRVPGGSAHSSNSPDQAIASAAQAAQTPTLLNSNLSVLQSMLPASAECVGSARPPDSAQLTQGRDGKPTYAWSDETGSLQWLGRATMPEVRGRALVDAFNPGQGNTLLLGLGNGVEASLLLQRLAPHQAVMIVEECGWSARLALGLHDFTEDIRRRRFLPFIGPEPWRMLGDFLTENLGFLAPERILSWPWLSSKEAAAFSEKLSLINRQVAQHRAAARSKFHHGLANRQGSKPTGAIAVISNIADASMQRRADRIAATLAGMPRPCVRLTLDTPASVHPYECEKRVVEASPAHLVLLDTVPGGLSYDLPATPGCVLCSHSRPMDESRLKPLPPHFAVGVPTDAQRRQAIEAGVPQSRVITIQPAALPALDASREERGTRILVIAEGHDPSASGVGLNLATHKRLWNAASDILRQCVDGYCDDQAGEVLLAAERKLDITLDDAVVREGIVDRIRRVLGPVLVRRECCLALARAGHELDIYGGGWAHDPVLAEFDRGAWPNPEDVPSALQRCAAAVAITTSGGLQDATLDCMAAGLPVLIRRHPTDEMPDGLAGILDPARHIRRFGPVSELVSFARTAVDDPNALSEMADEAARHINAHHTWAHRLGIIIQSCASA